MRHGFEWMVLILALFFSCSKDSPTRSVPSDGVVTTLPPLWATSTTDDKIEAESSAVSVAVVYNNTVLALARKNKAGAFIRLDA